MSAGPEVSPAASGPPEHWIKGEPRETFMQALSPVWYSPLESDPLDGICGFVAEPHHGNSLGVVHGGALLTLADIAIWGAARRSLGKLQAFTVTLNAEFAAGAKLGDWVWASGELVRAGAKMIFSRGIIYANGEPALVFSGTLKRIQKRD